MSGVVKGVKKVFKTVGKAVKKVASGVAKVARKIAKSKVFKVALTAAAIYFGGAGIASMMGGGSFATGVGSAWGSLTHAGSSLLAGEFGTAASAIGNAWGTAGAAGAAQAAGTISGGLSAGSTYATQQLTSTAAQTSMTTAASTTPSVTSESVREVAANGLYDNAAFNELGNTAATQMQSNVASQAANQSGGGLLNLNVPTAADVPIPNASSVVKAGGEAGAGMSMGEGLMYSAGINGATQFVGGYFNAKAQEEALDEERDRRRENMLGKSYNNYAYNVNSAFAPKTLDELRGVS